MNLYKENVTERYGDIIIASAYAPATQNEINLAQKQYKDGKCLHEIFYDEPGWLYDSRWCAICGKSLGLI